MKDDDAYIKLLTQARQDLRDGKTLNLDGFKKRLDDLGLKTNEVQLFDEMYGTHGSRHADYHMGFSSYMQLLEYEELKHSLKQSIEAKIEARKATYIAVIAILVQIVLSAIEILK